MHIAMLKTTAGFVSLGPTLTMWDHVALAPGIYSHRTHRPTCIYIFSMTERERGRRRTLRQCKRDDLDA